MRSDGLGAMASCSNKPDHLLRLHSDTSDAGGRSSYIAMDGGELVSGQLSLREIRIYYSTK